MNIQILSKKEVQDRLSVLLHYQRRESAHYGDFIYLKGVIVETGVGGNNEPFILFAKYTYGLQRLGFVNNDRISISWIPNWNIKSKTTAGILEFYAINSGVTGGELKQIIINHLPEAC